MPRRNFIANTAKAGIALGVGATAVGSFLQASASPTATNSPLITGFEQTPLPYTYNALEPIIDAQTMEIHYTKHAAAYAKALKEAATAENVSTQQPLETVLAGISKYSAKMRNNAGGHFNHELFWHNMQPGTATAPTGKLATAVTQAFGSFENFQTQFNEAAKTRFGSGWAWLYLDNDKKLKVGSSPNQDNPLMDLSDIKGQPLLGLDVWEHAYYLHYQNRRPEYITNWWKVINWDNVAKRYDSFK